MKIIHRSGAGHNNPMQIKSSAARVTGIEYTDIKARCRKPIFVIARKLIAIEARRQGYRHHQIADMIGRTKNDSVHLIREALLHIETNDKIFMHYYTSFKSALI